MRTALGSVNDEVLRFTVGKDPITDLVLAEMDCIGSAAHATMLSRLRVKPRLLSGAELRRIVHALADIVSSARRGNFRITMRDQDVHMAVERMLISRLGNLGKKVHTGRSRNDQVALDLRLYARGEILGTMEEAAGLAGALLALARKHLAVPMVGRTHMQPAMPSSVGLWASAYAESLLDDIDLLDAAFDMNDRSPLGAAAGYGVPLPIDRELTARLLGFGGICHNVLHAVNARGKCESVILFAMAQVMLSLSRLAADMIVYSMPEFGYFRLPAEYCTGSSIMPQKRNPDVLELVRAKAATVLSHAFAVSETLRGLPGGYNRDMQETKAPFIDGIAETRASLRIVTLLVGGVEVDRHSLRKAFTPEVFAADRALELVGKGVAFRDAYDAVKRDLGGTVLRDPAKAAAAKRHLGAPGGIDFAMLDGRRKAACAMARSRRGAYCRSFSRLMGVDYTELGP